MPVALSRYGAALRGNALLQGEITVNWNYEKTPKRLDIEWGNCGFHIDRAEREMRMAMESLERFSTAYCEDYAARMSEKWRENYSVNLGEIHRATGDSITKIEINLESKGDRAVLRKLTIDDVILVKRLMNLKNAIDEAKSPIINAATLGAIGWQGEN
jgi:hypothetical protein